ncbi:uncharacterized protein DUF3899 [Sinobaca qinghaiensis]|uniref:Uncharacterized protein DUF3899 n=2 Tax=Sinobaca qinghaiensis TaxID=342944 RepID=A0A419UU74_9BACL|nr:uncharacterized protein DUF3899 [Sinobaca qinghaiensis]
MANVKINSALFAVNLMIILVLFFGLFSNKSFLDFINGGFYVFSVYFILSLIFFVIKGKFFDGIIYSFRRFSSRVAKGNANEDYLQKRDPSETLSSQFLSIWYYQTIILAVFICFLLLLYYSL